MTTRPERHHLAELERTMREVVVDYLAVDVERERSTIFVQSRERGDWRRWRADG